MSKTTSIDIGTFTNVGIGDPTPTRALDIRASADTTNGLKDISLIGTNKGDAPMLSLKSYYDGANVGQRTFQLQVVDGNNTAVTRAMVLQPDGGNVGVGTTNPSLAKLQIEGDNDLLRLISTRSGAGGAEIALVQNSDSPANEDAHGIINFIGNDTDDAIPLSKTFSSIRGITHDALNSKGRIGLFTRNGGVFEEALSVAAGKVGIGTTNPLSKFVIKDGTDTTASSLEVNCGNNSVLIDALQRDNNNTPSPIRYVAERHLFLGSTGGSGGEGSVGIGTTNPSQGKLVTTGYGGHSNTRSFVAIAHNNNVESYFRIARMGSGDSTSVSLANNYNRDVPAYQADDNTAGISDITFRDDGVLSFSTGAVGVTEPVEKMRIDASGNVGIGTTSPKVIHHISTESDSTNYAVTRFSADNQQFDLGVGGSTASNADLRGKFYLWDSTNNNARLIVDSTGNVGIGTTSPVTRLDIAADSSAPWAMQIERADNSGQNSGRVFFDSSVGAWAVLNENGNFQLRWNGTPGSHSGTSKLQVVANANAWSAVSDEKLKENISEISNALDIIKDKRCSRFNYSDDSEKKKFVGFIAQDWVDDLPEIVNVSKGLDADDENDTDEYLGLEYQGVIPVLTKAIQEQQTIIEDLKARLQAVENR